MTTTFETLPVKLPPLENGDHLDQPTFHARYEAMPEDCRAQLIGGIVYMGSRHNVPHSRAQGLVCRWLDEYAESTPGTETLLSHTHILGPHSEPEPDATLYVIPESSGQVWVDEDDYLNGVPDLIVEVARATESIDLHSKKLDYLKAGVPEYVVVTIRTRKVFWFIREHGKYTEVALPDDGIFRSRVFPGLWLDAEAMLSDHRRHLLTTLRKGLATPEHAAFVARLKKQAARNNNHQ